MVRVQSGNNFNIDDATVKEVTPPKIKHKKVNIQPADWYIPELSTSSDIPTIFSKETNVNQKLSAEQIQSNFMLRGKAFDDWYKHSLSPERLALHQTIVEMAFSFKWESEKKFQDTALKIYEDRVLPLISEKKRDFDFVRKKTEEQVQKSWQSFNRASSWPNTKLKPAHPKIKQYIQNVSDKFNKNLDKYQSECDELKNKITAYDNKDASSSAKKPSAKERARFKELNDLIQDLKASKEDLIVKYVTDILLLENNQKEVETLLVGDNLTSPSAALYDPSLIKEYALQHNKMLTSEDRQGIIVAGGAASGKGNITDLQKAKLFSDGVIELNPDLYKPILLPFKDFNSDIQLHGSLTHQESSDVFDKLTARYQQATSSNKAPHILMDVARAGSWMRSIVGAGDTKIEIHTPVLDTLEALKRSFSRGQATGRFMPTQGLAIGHKDQIFLNKRVIEDETPIYFYNNDIPFGEKPPVAFFYAGQGDIEVNDVHTLYTYFTKGSLNPYGINAEQVDQSTPASVVKDMLSYVTDDRHMVFNDPKTEQSFANLSPDTLEISDHFAYHVPKSLHKDLFHKIIQGALENGLNIKCNNPDIQNLVSDITERLDVQKSSLGDITVPEYDFDTKSHIDMLKSLSETGTTYVSKIKPVLVYNVPKDKAEFKKKFPNGITLIKTDSEGIKREHKIDPENDNLSQCKITFNTKHFTAEQAQKEIDILKKVGLSQNDNITINKSSFDGKYIQISLSKLPSSDICEMQSLPFEVTAIQADSNKNIQYLSSSKGEPKLVRKDGWIKTRQDDLPKLQKALDFYHEDNEKYLANLLKVSQECVYESGPGNIETGFSYKISQKRDQLLTQLLTNPVVLHDHKGNRYHAIQSNSFIALSSDQAVKKDEWVIVPRSGVENIKKMLLQGGSSEFDNLPKSIEILNDEAKKRKLPN